MSQDQERLRRRDWDDALKPPRAPDAMLAAETRRAGIVKALAALVLVMMLAMAVALWWSVHLIDTLVASDGRLATSASGEHSVVDVILDQHETVYFHVVLHVAQYRRRLDL